MGLLGILFFGPLFIIFTIFLWGYHDLMTFVVGLTS
jgi:hypothetical protein